MRAKVSWILNLLILIPGAVVANVIVKELWREWDLRDRLQRIEEEVRPRLPIEAGGETLLSLTHRGTTPTYTIKVNLDRPEPRKLNLDPPPPGASIDHLLKRTSPFSPWAGIKQRVTRVVCSNPRLLMELRDGATLEYQYLDRRYLPAGSFFLTAGDCSS